MIRNYLKVAWRSLYKNRSASLISAASLAIGMAVAILIATWIQDELTYNTSFENYPRIAQVMQHQNFNGDVHTDKAISIPLATKLRQDYGDDFTFIVLSSWTNSHLLSFREKNISFTGNYMEPDAAKMLTLKMVQGSRDNLSDPSSLLICQNVRKAIFGNDNAVGQIVKLDGKELKVAGVYENLPAGNSFHDVNFIAPWALFSKDDDVKNAQQDWGVNSFQLFAQIAEGRDMHRVSLKIKDVKRTALGADGSKLNPVVFLQPMSRWHLYAEFKNGINTGGQVQYVWMFGIIGLFVLLLACINFMNLSTARSEKRAKEVGIRKTIGSLRRDLILQFYLESFLFAFTAFIAALFLVQLLLPYLNDIAGREMKILWKEPWFWMPGICFILVTGLLAGSYPAFYLSSFQPVRVLKGSFKAGRYAGAPRKVLVILQFTVSLILVVGTITVFEQIRYGKSRPAGYDHAGLVIIRPYNDDFHKHLAAVRNDLLQSGLITDVAEGSFISKGSRSSGDLQWKGRNPSSQDMLMTFAVSTEYGKAVKWEVISGRDFSKELSTDSAALILNEAAVNYVGFTNPVGEKINWGKQYTVIGVTKDIIMKSPFEPAVPTVYYLDGGANYLNIKMKPGADESKALSVIQRMFKTYSPKSPFEYKLADDEYGKKFGDEIRTRNLAFAFTSFAIFISCLGLFGLASFVTEQRTKEIGIRKIVGASALDIWTLLSSEFIILVGMSLLVAVPSSWYFMHHWLENYEYRTGLSWWIFLITGCGMLMITLMTVSVQSIKAAIANPVNSLRTE